MFVAVEQSLGRITRLNADKNQPVLFDIADISRKATTTYSESRISLYQDRNMYVYSVKLGACNLKQSLDNIFDAPGFSDLRKP